MIQLVVKEQDSTLHRVLRVDHLLVFAVDFVALVREVVDPVIKRKYAHDRRMKVRCRTWKSVQGVLQNRMRSRG